MVNDSLESDVCFLILFVLRDAILHSIDLQKRANCYVTRKGGPRQACKCYCPNTSQKCDRPCPLVISLCHIAQFSKNFLVQSLHQLPLCDSFFTLKGHDVALNLRVGSTQYKSCTKLYAEYPNSACLNTRHAFKHKCCGTCQAKNTAPCRFA